MFDDINVLMENNHDLDTFNNKMNTIHPNLQFTIERPNDNKLPFLDTEIKKISNKLQNTNQCI